MPEHNAGVDVVPQIIARDGREMAEVIDVVRRMGYTRTDVNMGCPFPLQTRHGRGAALLQQPDKVRELAAVMRDNSDITFSLKMRLGMDDTQEWRNVIDIINDMPLIHVTVHPRIARQQYKGELCMAAFNDILDACRHLIIYNGDINSVADINHLHDEYGPRIAAVMIGRGLLARPCMARDYISGCHTDASQLTRELKDMHKRMLSHYEKTIPGESQRLQKVRTVWDFMENTLGRKQWKRLMKAGNMKNYLAAVMALQVEQ